MTDKTPPRPARAGDKANAYNPARPGLFTCPKCGEDGRRENCPDVATCPFHALPLRAAYQKAQADMNESMQRRLDRIAPGTPWLKPNLVEDLQGFCPKCGAPKHIGPCPGATIDVHALKGERDSLKLQRDALRETEGRLRGWLANGGEEITRLRRQNRRLRRKLARERNSWDRALEVAARIAEASPMGAAAAKAIRAAKIGGEE